MEAVVVLYADGRYVACMFVRQDGMMVKIRESDRKAAIEEILALRAENVQLREAVDYMGNRANWIELDEGYKMKRPGGGGRSGIMLISETLNPWDYINKALGLRSRSGGAG